MIKTKIRGIAQTDLILRSAIKAALEDIRRNPYLFDYMFAQLLQDELTNKEYGVNVINRAKEWFLKTDIPVFMDTHVNAVKFPCVVIKMVSSNETEKTVGDVDGTAPYEKVDFKWDNLVPPFNPVSYDALTGIMTLPESVVNALFIVAGMVVVDKNGIVHPITDASTLDTITIDKGQFDFNGSTIRGAKPTYVAAIESCGFNESYQIGCFVDSETDHLVFLHTILVFILLRYKENLFEERGFEKSIISSASFSTSPITEVQSLYSRFLTISGQVRHYWPKTILPQIEGVVVEATLELSEPGNTEEVDWWDEESIPSSFNKKPKQK